MKQFLVSLALVVASVVLGLMVPTVARHSQADFDDAQRVGTGTVYLCTEYGPLTFAGFGYTSKCRVDVVWRDGSKEMVNPNRYGFADASELGRTITIGDLGNGKYARPDRPFRPLIVVTAWLIALVAVAALLLGLAGLRRALRERVSFR
ncbi:hypothetical protein ACWT_2923 [Actinoplanes sp. SE50]|uniref:DUF6346 domain-containing protein n=1 Tax=unclassified Actinoplanes TaxID=2626549 RepID=UPI00023EC09A|nr:MULTISPECIES: DUF6346 domain-containing protein [unclassified Actinoplanes]AEV83518.1 hypothetical protein ACPL_2623 [Actinoplanes sp. SE50/110]ATO82338.1 hypothetical protein ACWT_2923 [Actinoplanes sp. SE50]SLL99745.1 uncharacterized protein ACSP50_2976 [Actinoplanes sp. SE50/110]